MINQAILILVGVPGYSPPPIVCGYITGQHMWVPASDSCVTVTLDIDTATTATTRKWNIKVTQYECENLMAPERNCLQYHTAQTGLTANIEICTRICNLYISIGSFASFNWDTRSTSSLKTDLWEGFKIHTYKWSFIPHYVFLFF